MTVPRKAEAIRHAAKAVLPGATLSSVVRQWNADGMTTTTKQHGKWGVTQLRRVLMNPRYAGKRVYSGEAQVVAGKWEAILDEETSRRLEEMLTDPRRKTAPDDLNSKYLLSGFAICGKCGSKMFAAPVSALGGGKRMVYRCFGGYCMQRSLAQIDEFVQGVVVGVLARPDAAQLFASDGNTAELRRKATGLRDRRDQLAALLADGLLSAAAVREQSAS